MRVFITGIAGFLGRHLTEFLINKGHFVMGIDNNFDNVLKFRSMYPKVPVLHGSICNSLALTEMRYLMMKHNITHVVHAAANKYIEQNEESPVEALEVNIMGSANVANLCTELKIGHLIALSTDKAVAPTSIYGHTKLMMEELMTVMGYASYQGVNFFASDGSVIPIWYSQAMANKSLTVRDLDCIRYFVPVSDVVSEIYELLNLDTPPKGVFLPKHSYAVKLHDLLDAFLDHFNYTDYVVGKVLPYEKVVEDINEKIIIKSSDKELIIGWLAQINPEDLI